MRERTEPFEQAWRAARGAELDWGRTTGAGGIAVPPSTDHLSAVLQARWDGWAAHRQGPRFRLRRTGGRLAAIGVTVVLLGYFFQFGRIGISLILLGILLAIGGSFGHRRIVTIDRDCADRACPDCGYDLSGTPEGLPGVAAAGRRAGPARCPECGIPWPFIPPPLG
ncbi:MAG TPA: hypothetical protein VG797_09300 [Phycisphaerales bacterium]|nr:hypothetical protein [Phycisphaerales bacterium]